MSQVVDAFMQDVIKRNPGEPEFHQAVREVIESVYPMVEANPAMKAANILGRIVEPERIISFRVPWVDDKGQIQVNRGYRVQFNSALGPYKGGIRFHPDVSQGTLKFLAFEQTFKNALTGLPLGGGKGGADFDPRGKSDAEVMRFCQSFMAELFRYVGQETDSPAGDINVGGREIGYMFGMYKKLANEFSGAITGKGVGWGGSRMRTEATGYGVTYFAEEMFNRKGDSLKGKVCAVSGAGNVGLHVIEMVNKLGGKVIAINDLAGLIIDDEGIDNEKLAVMKDIIFNKRQLLDEYAKRFPKAKFIPNEFADAEKKKLVKGYSPWQHVKVDVAFPCSRQNELVLEDAQALLKNGLKALVEGANMPCTPDAIKAVHAAKVMFSPGKASNAGGVATSGLEMSQNAGHIYWSAEEVNTRLHQIMKEIHGLCVQYGGEEGGVVNYERGANVAGFMQVAKAMLAQGVV